jgi:hypothetical protein
MTAFRVEHRVAFTPRRCSIWSPTPPWWSNAVANVGSLHSLTPWQAIRTTVTAGLARAPDFVRACATIELVFLIAPSHKLLPTHTTCRDRTRFSVLPA